MLSKCVPTLSSGREVGHKEAQMARYSLQCCTDQRSVQLGDNREISHTVVAGETEIKEITD